ncbi:sulfurtransferase complex subunit TusC [Microbulbifer sp. HZ11]|uniref:sulfurtransferase complex subunit TusC n=1 Tax=unclassified Microbulbifer TaxID=2619833 RepID=UPI0005BE0EF3|nr:sulfurtransferase complex subunit TusC [Microbulbifer sp. HZ11]
MTNSILALCRHAPYGTTFAREGLEAVLACAAMDQIPEVLFINDGVYQLLAQNPQAIAEKSLYRNLQALPMFGVERIYICQRSATERGLALSQLQLTGADVQLLEDPGSLIRRFDQVLSF